MKNRPKFMNEFLMFQAGDHRHDVHSFPDLVIRVNALALPVPNERFKNVGIQDQQFCNHP